MTLSISAAQARRIFLNAQGLARKRPAVRVKDQHLHDYLRRQGVIQLDSVNVLERAHYLPAYSRLGPYDQAQFDSVMWGGPDDHSAHAFEHWGHEAAVMPMELLPAMHHRMVASGTWKQATGERLDRERPGLIESVRRAALDHGPVTAAALDHLAPAVGARGSWWDASHVKLALELLFITGRLAASRGRHFARTYDAPERAWGRPAADAPESAAWALEPPAARQQLFDRALAACGIGTAKDLCDHFRLPVAAGARSPDVAGGQAWALSAVERGLAQWVQVEGWDAPALLAVGGPTEHVPWHRAGVDPGRATGAALLSPFDPVCWYRPRLLRMFACAYRIEIYTPADKRVYGYYCLPFLLGDQVVGRLDLKADRATTTLLVQAAWREPLTAPGARRRSDDAVAQAMADELQTMATWLGRDRIVVAPRGTLAGPLADAVKRG